MCNTSSEGRSHSMKSIAELPSHIGIASKARMPWDFPNTTPATVSSNHVLRDEDAQDEEFLTRKTTCASENARKDHLPKNLSKKTPYGWRHVWPGDTWHVPTGPTPEWGCRHSQRRHVCCRRRPLEEVGPAATAKSGRLRWHMPPGGEAAPPHADSPAGTHSEA
jgi:hypothetical protein